MFLWGNRIAGCGHQDGNISGATMLPTAAPWLKVGSRNPLPTDCAPSPTDCAPSHVLAGPAAHRTGQEDGKAECGAPTPGPKAPAGP